MPQILEFRPGLRERKVSIAFILNWSAAVDLVQEQQCLISNDATSLPIEMRESREGEADLDETTGVPLDW